MPDITIGTNRSQHLFQIFIQLPNVLCSIHVSVNLKLFSSHIQQDRYMLFLKTSLFSNTLPFHCFTQVVYLWQTKRFHLSYNTGYIFIHTKDRNLENKNQAYKSPKLKLLCTLDKYVSGNSICILLQTDAFETVPGYSPTKAILTGDKWKIFKKKNSKRTVKSRCHLHSNIPVL